MKNFIYISLLMLGLFATSCSKEEVVMSNSSIDAVPTWEDSSSERSASPVTGDTNTQDGVVSGETGVGGQTGGVSPIEGDITDPNNDPDGKKKKL